MASFSIELSATAEKQLRKMNQADQLSILRVISALGNTPRPRGARKLQGYADVFRVRVGHYRIIYSIEAKRLVVIILKVGHRKDVYR